MTKKYAGVWLVAMGALGGCGAGETFHSNKATKSSAALVAVNSCEDALSNVRTAAIAQMNDRIDEIIDAYARGESCYYYRGDADYAAGVGAPQAGGPAPAPSNSTGGSSTPTTPSSPSQTSGTNNQVAGVDEADFVKNDGKYIYLAHQNVFRIIESWPANATHEVSRTELNGTPRKLFVDGNTALVYVSVPKNGTTSPSSGRSSSECTYGYNCSFTGDGNATKLLVYDITDRAAPVLQRTLDASGSLIAARRIGRAVHTVVSDLMNPFADLKYYASEDLCGYAQQSSSYWNWLPGGKPYPTQADIDKARTVYNALREKNRALIESTDLSGILPRFSDSANLGQSGVLGEALCNGYASAISDGTAFTTLISVALDGNAPAKTATIVSRPGAVYASSEALYLAVPQEEQYAPYWYDGWQDTKQVSSIHKFRISDVASDTAYRSSGIVKGRALNQFAMDEHNGNLRVATTTGRVPDPKVESQLTVLADSGTTLDQIGIIEHIAPTEDIRSVRFDGDHGFVVTFKKTDPLYALNLSDPTAPRIEGELKIPGFSTYMHLLDATHLLSIGYDADDKGSFAFFNGVLIQIFDVSDMTNPTLAWKHVIGTRGSSSEALTNHLAFNYFAPKGLLSIPMTICEGGGDGSYGQNMTFSGLMLFDISVASGISERGRVSHQGQLGSEVSCRNWWTNASSVVKRSIFMDDFVYSIADDVMKVQSLPSLGTDLVSLPLD